MYIGLAFVTVSTQHCPRWDSILRYRLQADYTPMLKTLHDSVLPLQPYLRDERQLAPEANRRLRSSAACVRIQVSKKAPKQTQTLRAGCSKAEPKNFAAPQTPFPGAREAKI